MQARRCRRPAWSRRSAGPARTYTGEPSYLAARVSSGVPGQKSREFSESEGFSSEIQGVGCCWEWGSTRGFGSIRRVAFEQGLQELAHCGGVADGGLFVDTEDGGQVYRVGAGGQCLLELAVDGRRSRVAVRPRRALVIQTLLTGPVSSAQRLSQGSSDTSYISGQRVRSRFPTVNTRPTSPAQQARAALGVRLREIRKGASLTARDLAITFGCHFSKISRIANGVQAPSEANIKAWCRACNAERQIPDLIATARAIESMHDAGLGLLRFQPEFGQ
jgi:hypothetical protein